MTTIETKLYEFGDVKRRRALITTYDERKDNFLEKYNLSGNPFEWDEADRLTYDLIADLFKRPSDYGRAVMQKNAIVEGNRGSGKSMLLLFLSLITQIRRWQQKVSMEEFIPPFIGVYIKCSEEVFTSYRDSSRGKSYYETFFRYLFNLAVCNEIVDTLERTKGHYRLTEVNEEKITKKLEKVMEEELERQLHHEESIVDTKTKSKQVEGMGEVSFNAFLLSLKSKIVGKEAILNGKEKKDIFFYETPSRVDFLYRVGQTISDILSEEGKRLPIFILLDEFDYLTQPQQELVNEIIRIRKHPLYFKIASAQFGSVYRDVAKHKLRLGQDVDYVNLSEFDTPLEQFAGFVKDIANARLSAFGATGFTIEDLIPKYETSPSGINDFAFYSSGIVRIFLRLCKYSIVFAISDSKLTDFDPSTGIPQKCQEMALHEVASDAYQPVHELRDIKNMIDKFGELFSKKSIETNASTFEFVINDIDQLDGGIITSLNSCVAESILQIPGEQLHGEISVPYEKYALNRILMPIYGIPKKEAAKIESIEIDAHDLNKILTNSNFVSDVLSKRTG